MQKTYKSSNNMWQLDTDADHILHEIGKEEYSVIRHIMTKDPDRYEEVPAYMPQVVEARKKKLEEITAYDKSAAVDNFILDGEPAWLDRDTRRGLDGRLKAESVKGRDATTLWLGTRNFPMPIAVAQALLATLEVYAADCYDRTAAHKAKIMTLESVEAIEAYDFTTGYPPKPNLSTTTN